MNYLNQLSLGFEFSDFRDKKIASNLGIDSVTEEIEKYKNNDNYNIVMVSPEMAHRPDTISFMFYETATLWWLILLVNNISDPFEGLNSGDLIKVPIV